MDTFLQSRFGKNFPSIGNPSNFLEDVTSSRNLTGDEPLYKKIARFKALHQHLVANTPYTHQSASHQASLLFRLANQIRNSLDLETILQTTVSEVRNLLQIDYCHFLWCLVDGNHQNLTITHEAKTSNLPNFLGDLPSQQTDVLAKAIIDLTPLRIDQVSTSFDLSTEARSLLTQFGITSSLLLPLKTHSDQYGAILCSHCHPRSWSDNDIELLQAVIDQVANALDQAELLARAQATALAAQTQATYLAEALHKLQQTQAQLVQHEKMSSLGQLVAGVAHEINNPVNFISGNISHATSYIHNLLELLQLYQECYPEADPRIQAKADEIDLMFIIDDLLKILSSMVMGTDRIRQIVLSLRNFSRLDEADVKPVDIHEGLENTLLILKSRLKTTGKGRTIRVIREYEKLPLVECYAGQLNQVFMNLLSNAIDALEEVPDPTIMVRTEILDTSSTTSENESTVDLPCVLIRIQDNGAGISEAVKQKIFNPFFTTKPVGKGTGLGLSISYQIVVEKHRGSLRCISEPGHGTEFLIQIPVRSPLST